MLVQPTKDEDAGSERPSESQPTTSPPHPSEVHVEPQSDPSPRPLPTSHIPDSILESSGGNHGGQSSSDKSLSGNEGDMTLQSVYDLCISLCTQNLDEECILESKIGRKEILEEKLDAKGVCIQTGRKSAKAEPTVHKDKAFDELDDDEIDNMETKDAQEMGRTRYVVHEEKERKEKEVSTEDALIPDKKKDSTDRPDEGTVDQTEGTSATPTTPTPTPTTFGDDETIAQVLLNMSQAKAIDPKDKGKKKIEEDESDTESKDINESEKKFKMLAHDEEIARKVQDDWEAEEEVKKLAKEEATNAALIQDIDNTRSSHFL
ncbi:hypothetical protein Tco_0859987 [Tanacetum coccineum]|uniref:Uncharacterized protein n=1 Tax=Tanacetum coccineum TaxID=301880 RepID=A0ABQ5BDK9_9ASTR